MDQPVLEGTVLEAAFPLSLEDQGSTRFVRVVTNCGCMDAWVESEGGLLASGSMLADRQELELKILVDTVGKSGSANAQATVVVEVA